MKTLAQLLESWLADGKYFLSKEEAIVNLDISDSVFHKKISRFIEKGKIKNVGHSLYMIVPAEYSHMGSVPLTWVVSALMNHLKVPYYVGLLSAASLYGATHQQPMVFQVIVEKPLRGLVLPRGKVQFLTYKHIATSTIEEMEIATGRVKVSSKSQTVLDLIRFQNKCGYLDNVASVIEELAEEISAVDLHKTIVSEKEETVLQRIGYILDLYNFNDLAFVVEEELKHRKTHMVPLKPYIKKRSGERSHKWNLIINDPIEGEE